MTQNHAGHLPTITADFNGTSVTIIERDGQRWLTADQIGLALGYNPANARAGLNNLYGRHTDEFSSADTCVIKLMTQGQMRETRIFSATGCIKLGFFASTPKAKEFRTWASEVLAEHSSRAVQAVQESALSEQATDLLGSHVVELTRQVTLLMNQVMRLSRKVITTQGQLIRTQKHVTTLVEGRMDGAQASATIVQMHRDGHSNAQIVAATGRNTNHVRQTLWQARRDGVLPPLADAASTASAQANLFKGA